MDTEPKTAAQGLIDLITETNGVIKRLTTLQAQMQAGPGGSRELALGITNLQQGRLWLQETLHDWETRPAGQMPN